LKEAGLPENAGEDLDNAWTVEKILEEKQLYDLTVNFETSNLNDDVSAWRIPCKMLPTIGPMCTSNQAYARPDDQGHAKKCRWSWHKEPMCFKSAS
jgi:hypothetical protein